MEKIVITVTIENGIVEITDNLGNTSNNDLDPDIMISDQIGTYVTDFVENNNIYADIIEEGVENEDYLDEEDFDELDD